MTNATSDIRRILRETCADISDHDRTILQHIQSCTSERIVSTQYDPFFAYGGEDLERWSVEYAGGTSAKLIAYQWGNTDGYGIALAEWDGFCAACGHDWLADCHGNCTCLSCNALAQKPPAWWL